MNKKIIWTGIAMLILVIVFVSLHRTDNPGTIKIGVITDLTGPAAYWGESTKAGADILQRELAAKGKKVIFIFEDYALDAAKAATAAQKLVSIDKVGAIYAEFNPGAIAAGSFLKDKGTPFIYDAAVISPLEDNQLFYKTYLDYEEGCRQVAQKFKDEGVSKIGLLKVNLEFGQLCQNGVMKVFGTELISEGYNLGDTDFRTQLLKIKNAGATAVMNVGFEGDTSNTLKIIKDFKYNLRYGTVDDTITDRIRTDYGHELKNGWSFGFADPSEEFMSKLASYKTSSPYGAALAYTHLSQLVLSLDACGSNKACVGKSLDASKTDDTIQFNGYHNRIADLTMNLKKY